MSENLFDDIGFDLVEKIAPPLPPIIPEITTVQAPVITSVATMAVTKKGIKLWHVLVGIAALGLFMHFRNKRKKQKDQEKFNGWR